MSIQMPKHFVSGVFTMALAMVVLALSTDSAEAQLRDRSLPDSGYYLSFGDFYAGDYGDALKQFVRGGNTAFKIGPNERFLDSACYWTMAGECHYHLGNYAEATAFYEQAIDLAVTYAKGDWQERIRPPQQIQKSSSAQQRAQINWYRSNRGNEYANIPNSFSMLFGRLDASRVLVEGGTLQNAEIRPVDHAEIMRCISLAIYRRYTIKGITSHIDPFTAKMISGLSRLPTSTAVIGPWNSIVRGLANMSGGRAQQAVRQLQAGLTLRSGLEHHLTPIALMGLANLAYVNEELDPAAGLALEASYSAGVFNQFDLVEDALKLGTSVHLAKNKSAYPPLAPAIQWARKNKTRKLQTSLLIQLADCLVEANDSEAAATTLSQTKRSMGGTDLGRSPLSGQIRYLSAAIAFFQNRDGLPDLQRALQQFQSSSLWLYRLRLIDSSLAAGTITQRQAEAAYQRLLIDPGARQWQFNPMETVAYVTSAHVQSMEAWFEILLSRKNHEKAIQVAERIRRHRFYESLPFSGRWLALRWLLMSPEAGLNKVARQQRSEFLKKFPEFATSLQQVASIEQQLRAIPLKPDEDSPQKKQQQDLLVELLKLSRNQESLLRAVSLTRQPAELVFPPAVDYSEIAKNLNEHQVTVAALQTSSGYHMYVVTQETRRYLGVVRERDLRRAMGKLYKSLGISDSDNNIERAVLQSEEWKAAAADVKNLIFKNYSDDKWDDYKELVVVPDGILWYLPFEILQTGNAVDDWKPLHEQIKIRYLPMASMISGTSSSSGKSSRVAVVTGKMHPKAELELTQRGFEDLTDSITNAAQFNRQSKIPSNLLNASTDAMVVWHTSDADKKNQAYNLTPFHLDKGREGSTLGEWMLAPWKGVDTVVLPAFSSNVAGGLRSRSNGAEMFFTTCGLLASGSRTILLSRWSAGGQNAIDLSRRFLVDAQEMSSIEALEKSNKEARESDLVLENEIRIKPSAKSTDTFKAEHPFFWAGNMLVDLNGYKPPTDDADAAKDADLADAADPANAADAGSDQKPAGSDAKDPNDPFVDEPDNVGEPEKADAGSDAKKGSGSNQEPAGSTPKQEPSEGSGLKH